MINALIVLVMTILLVLTDITVFAIMYFIIKKINNKLKEGNKNDDRIR